MEARRNPCANFLAARIQASTYLHGPKGSVRANLVQFVEHPEQSNGRPGRPHGAIYAISAFAGRVRRDLRSIQTACATSHGLAAAFQAWPKSALDPQAAIPQSRR